MMSIRIPGNATPRRSATARPPRERPFGAVELRHVALSLLEIVDDREALRS